MAARRQRILLIEGDQALGSFIARTLKSQRFDLIVAPGSARVLPEIDRHTPDLILLDLALPEGAGLALCAQLRQHSPTPIIVYSARNDQSCTPAALDLGVDDFLTAPFSADDLLARVRLALRPHRAPQPGALRSGRLELNLDTQSLMRDGQPVVLSRTDWALLALLARHPGQVLTHRMLLQHVWGDAYSDEHGYLRTYINRLRNKLEDDPRHPQYLLTEAGIGYRFVLPSEQPAPAPSPARSADLPLPPTSFVGREAEIDAVHDLLGRADLRLLTLVGPGGVGKTRLALQIATRIDARFADGVCFVALAPVRSAEMLLSTLSKALRISETGDQLLFERLAYELRSQELLLVLDNFEQILEAAPLVAALLQRCARLKILVTSRSPLHVYGEHELTVSPLALPDPQSLRAPAELIAHPALALFADRARAVRPDFTLSAQTIPLVAEICARLDGLPLAIELAAAWSKILSPAAIAARLSDRLALLTGGACDLPVRQQTLRSTLDWSYELLAPEQRVLFARVAVFIGGGTLEALEEVCQIDTRPAMALLSGLAALVDASLLQQQPEPGGEPRFVMLETIRDYAQERLVERGEHALIRRRHAQHYLRLAEAATVASPDQRRWLSRLEREHDNLRAALEWTRGHGQAEMLIRLAGALWNFWHMHGHQREGRQWLAAALDRPEALPLALRARALYGIGWLARDQGDYGQAATYHHESLLLFRQLNDRHGIAEALRGLGELALSQGDLAQAQTLFEESLALSQPGTSTEDRAWSLNHLGRVALEQGTYGEAQRLLEHSLLLFRELHVQAGMGWSLHNLGRVALARGAHTEAQALIEESLGLFHELGDKIGIAWSLHNLGRAALAQGTHQAAHALLEQSLLLFDALADTLGIAWSHYVLGRAALAQGNDQQARRHFETSLSLFRTIDDRPGADWAAHQLGQLALDA